MSVRRTHEVVALAVATDPKAAARARLMKPTRPGAYADRSSSFSRLNALTPDGLRALADWEVPMLCHDLQALLVTTQDLRGKIVRTATHITSVERKSQALAARVAELEAQLEPELRARAEDLPAAAQKAREARQAVPGDQGDPRGQ